MPPKPDPKAAPVEEKKGPPPAAKKYPDELIFKTAAKAHMTVLEAGALPAGAPADAKGGKAPAKAPEPAVGAPVDKASMQFSKDQCKQYIELCSATWLEDKDIEDFWSKIPKSIDKEGKPLETVSRKGLKNFTLQRTWDKLWITKTRLETDLETAPGKAPIDRYEVVMLDFFQNDFLSDVTLLNKKTNASYK